MIQMHNDPRYQNPALDSARGSLIKKKIVGSVHAFFRYNKFQKASKYKTRYFNVVTANFLFGFQ